MAPASSGPAGEDAGVGAEADASPLPPSAAPCPARFETIATFDGGSNGFISFPVGPNAMLVAGGTIFFAVQGKDSGPSVGIWAVPASGGVPRRISNEWAAAMWAADSRDLLLADYEGLYTMPMDGGPRTQVAATPGSAFFQVDDANEYFLQQQTQPYAIWRQPRAGGSPVQIGSTPSASKEFSFAPFAADDASLYLLASTGTSAQGDPTGFDVLRLPKSGGAPVALPGVLNYESGLIGVLAAHAGSAYVAGDLAARGYPSLVRVPASGGPVSIDAVLVPQAAVVDGTTLYVASISTAGAPAGSFSSGAVWRVDTTTDAASLVACGPPHEDGGGVMVPEAVLVDDTYVYGAFFDGADISHFSLMRARR